VQVVMTIIGPPTGNDTVYALEFGRVTFSDVQIRSSDFVEVSWAKATTDGYAMRDVSYP
jgi:hypothetical protein